jgi:3-isopropylmalate/(R)-2-methylmalate dehydratase small subunit
MGARVPASFSGRVWVFGDDINTDLVIPGFALYMDTPEQARHCFSANRPGWIDEVRSGDVLVAGRNFGVGSARPIGTVFAELGIAGIVAEGFNGLGLRNCVNAGVPVLPCDGVTAAFADGDAAEVDWTTGAVRNTTRGTSLEGEPIPEAFRDIVLGGGIEDMLRAEGFLD